MFDISDKPGVEETYQVAGNTSDLTVEADRRGAGDVMIAAGWSDSRVGMALLRLHSEWDGAVKRRGRNTMTDSDLRLLASRMKSRGAVWAQILPWVVLKGIDPDVAASALLHWMDDACRKCDGRGFFKIPDAPVLSTKRCKCNAGRAWPPNGTNRVVQHLDYCVSVARGSLKKRLRPEG